MYWNTHADIQRNTLKNIPKYIVRIKPKYSKKCPKKKKTEMFAEILWEIQHNSHKWIYIRREENKKNGKEKRCRNEWGMEEGVWKGL